MKKVKVLLDEYNELVVDGNFYIVSGVGGYCLVSLSLGKLVSSFKKKKCLKNHLISEIIRLNNNRLLSDFKKIELDDVLKRIPITVMMDGDVDYFKIATETPYELNDIKDFAKLSGLKIKEVEVFLKRLSGIGVSNIRDLNKFITFGFVNIENIVLTLKK